MAPPQREPLLRFPGRARRARPRLEALLVACCEAKSLAEREALVVKIGDEEHAADRLIHEVYEALNRTFVTPIDRSDIYALSSKLEDIVDAVHATALQIVIHAMEDVPAGGCELAVHVHKACGELLAAVRLLRGMKDLGEIRVRCKEVYRLEHDGDQIFRTKVGEMFKRETDAIHLLKHKEFLEGLERTLDVCDHAASVLEAVVIKNA